MLDGRMKASLTLRCEVVTSFSFLQDGWSLSKTMVSAPLQNKVSLPSGLRTGAREEGHITFHLTSRGDQR